MLFSGLVAMVTDNLELQGGYCKYNLLFGYNNPFLIPKFSQVVQTDDLEKSVSDEL